MDYRRAYVKGATYFFTINLQDRKQSLLVDNIDLLRQSFTYVKSNHPFMINAIVILPEHLHLIMTLPENDHDFSTRIMLIKQYFSRELNKITKRRSNKSIWQKRFWEHLIRDKSDYENHINYIHYNPVKHGYVDRASNWQYSSIHKFIENNIIDENWGDAILDNGVFYGE